MNPATSFRNVAIESVVYDLPPRSVTSSELEARLGPLMSRLKLPAGPIEALTGIAERRYWEAGTLLQDVIARVARRAVETAQVPLERVGALINTSVSRPFLEPSMASLVHGDLGLAPECVNFDVANACLGFINGIEIAGRMIDAGAIDYALVVDGESASEIVDATVARLQGLATTARDFWDNFATLTLGSAAVAMVLSDARLSRTSHRVNGSVTLADTSHSRLCLGTAEKMVTESTRLLKAGVALAKRTWDVASERLARWSDGHIDQYICHQVGRPHMASLCETLGIDLEKCFLSFPRHGNVGPAAVPLTLALAEQAGRVKPGDHVGLMGIGSGLNVAMMSVSW